MPNGQDPEPVPVVDCSPCPDPSQTSTGPTRGTGRWPRCDAGRGCRDGAFLRTLVVCGRLRVLELRGERRHPVTERVGGGPGPGTVRRTAGLASVRGGFRREGLVGRPGEARNHRRRDRRRTRLRPGPAEIRAGSTTVHGAQAAYRGAGTTPVSDGTRARSGALPGTPGHVREYQPAGRLVWTLPAARTLGAGLPDGSRRVQQQVPDGSLQELKGNPPSRARPAPHQRNYNSAGVRIPQAAGSGSER